MHGGDSSSEQPGPKLGVRKFRIVIDVSFNYEIQLEYSDTYQDLCVYTMNVPGGSPILT